jgi:virginiamycin B lyase
MRRLSVTVAVLSTAIAMLAPAAADAQVPRRDTVTGTLFVEPQCPGCVTPPRYVFDAVSEAGGGRPQGTVSYVTGERAGTFIVGGMVTCLRVSGTRATIGVNFEMPPGGSPPGSRSALLFLQDNGAASSDRIAVQRLPGATAPSSCPADPPSGTVFEPGHGGGTGVTIVDQQPGPVLKRQCRARGWVQYGFSSRRACFDFVEQSRILTGGIAEFPIPTPNSSPEGITAGPDGAVWFTEFNPGQIGRLTPTGRFTEFPIPTPGAIPHGIANGPDGALWFTESAGKLGRITTAGAITEFTIPQGSGAEQLATGPNGALWITAPNLLRPSAIIRGTTSGSFRSFPLPDPGALLRDVVAGPDGALWATVFTADRIARITTGGAVTEFPIPGDGPLEITLGPDGALWFTQFNAPRIGRITTSGVVTEFPLPEDFGVAGFGIASGPDGALWFTSGGSGRIGRMTPGGKFTSFPLPTYRARPYAIASGPGNVLWVTDKAANAIVRIASRPPTRRFCNGGRHVRFGLTTRAACRAFVHQVPPA